MYNTGTLAITNGVTDADKLTRLLQQMEIATFQLL